jgi:peptidoglycan-N-acetylglucosamine deacetylase
MIRFALTFDDGPGPSTPEILDTLKEMAVRATFFILGRNVIEPTWCNGDRQQSEGLVLRALRDGHVVGNHTYSHDVKPEPTEFIADLQRCDKVIHDLRKRAGVSRTGTIPVRLPYGIQLLPTLTP